MAGECAIFPCGIRRCRVARGNEPSGCRSTNTVNVDNPDDWSFMGTSIGGFETYVSGDATLFIDPLITTNITEEPVL